LEFARSRYAKGDEGTDLARAARQEKIIQAVKNKLLSKDFFLYPKKVLAVWQVVKDSVQTDLGTNALAIIAERALMGRNNIVQVTMPQEMLINPLLVRLMTSSMFLSPPLVPGIRSMLG